MILTEGPRLRAADLKGALEPLGAGDEEERIREALLETDGDKKRAAEILGISYRSLLRRVKEHDLEGFPKYRD